ncbi:MAG TPA: phosphate ABC transporter substrate-binding protein PstS, partial [Pyrinomonadaceae bacterium]|nr:phosphate ABC transporter substrate-binding protein PstS [Pyrinomonadaceae bacterium]
MTALSSKSLRVVLFLLVVAIAVGALACNGGSGGSQVTLRGAGATYPNPLYQKWISEYGKLHANVRIDYQSIGSGGGQKQIREQTVDFGASDSFMSDQDLKSAPGELLHIPMVLGAVVITHNLQGISQPLHFSPDVVADIFLGKIKRWDDPRIKADNAGVNLPAADITVVHRSDGSGTTGVWTDYLAKVSAEWKQKVGVGTSVNWPVGQGGKGNEGVTGQVKNQPNTIGYVELIYALQNNLPVGLIKNKSGNFVPASLDSVTAAATGALANTPDDLRVSITDSPGAEAYPVSSYTYILAYKDQKDAAKGKALADYLWWCIHDGEKFAGDLKYAPLPDEIV